MTAKYDSEEKWSSGMIIFFCVCGRSVPEEVVVHLHNKPLTSARCSVTLGGCGKRISKDQLEIKKSENPTLAEARVNLRNHLNDGVSCVCCGQFAKRYKRKLNTGIARWLIALERLHCTGLEWVHIAWIAAVVGGKNPISAQKLPIGKSPIGSGDYAKARYWQLIEDRPSATTAKKDSGYWKLTSKGRSFVNKSIKVPSRVILYNNICEGFDGDDITITDAIGTNFNYDELMGLSKI